MHPSQIATICHEANRVYAAAIGNPVPVPPWDEAPENVRAGTIAGVELYLSNPNLTPAEMHANWAATRKADGWVYGPEKDYALRTHPNLVDNYEDLPDAERRKVAGPVP